MFESETPSLVTRFERQMGSHTCPGALTGSTLSIVNNICTCDNCDADKDLLKIAKINKRLYWCSRASSQYDSDIVTVAV